MRKQITGGIVFSFISQIVSIVVGLTYIPIMIRILGQKEYGLYQLVQSVVNYLNLMNFGFNGAYIRYYSIAKTKNDEREISNINGMFMKVFLFISVICCLFGIALVCNISILGSKLTVNEYHTARILMLLLIINLGVSFPNSLYVAYMSANQKFVFQKVINIINNLLLPVCNLPLLYLGFGSVGIVSVTLMLSVLRLVINILYCNKYIGFSINFKYFDRKIFNGLLGYTFFIFLSDVVEQLNSNIDKLLLGRIMGTVSVAIYSVAYDLNYYRVIVSWIIPEMYVPEVNRLAIEENNKKKITLLFTKIGKLNNYLMILVITGFILVGKPFIKLWVGSGYTLSYYATIILMLSGYVSAVQTLGVNIQNAMNMHKTRSVIYFFVACINIILSIFLIKKWGVVGTCLGTLVAAILGQCIFMNYYYYRKIKLDIVYFWTELLRWIIPASVLFGVFYFFTHNIFITSWKGIFCLAIVYSICYFILLWLVGLKKEEKVRVIHSIKCIIDSKRCNL